MQGVYERFLIQKFIRVDTTVPHSTVQGRAPLVVLSLWLEQFQGGFLLYSMSESQEFLNTIFISLLNIFIFIFIFTEIRISKVAEALQCHFSRNQRQLQNEFDRSVEVDGVKNLVTVRL